MKALKRLLALAVFFGIFLGLALLIGNWWNLIWTWLPGMVAMFYLDESLVREK